MIDGSFWICGYFIMNYMIICFVDVLLMVVEVEVEVGFLEKVREYVNMVCVCVVNFDYWVKNFDGSNVVNY